MRMSSAVDLGPLNVAACAGCFVVSGRRRDIINSQAGSAGLSVASMSSPSPLCVRTRRIRRGGRRLWICGTVESDLSRFALRRRAVSESEDLSVSATPLRRRRGRAVFTGKHPRPRCRARPSRPVWNILRRAGCRRQPPLHRRFDGVAVASKGQSRTAAPSPRHDRGQGHPTHWLKLRAWP